jgi:electron transport complex protein RnfG
VVNQGDNTTRKKNGFRNNYIVQAWLGIVLALVFGIALSTVQAVLGPVIATNKINETKEKVPELLLGRDAGQDIEDQQLHITILPMTVAKKGIQKTYNVFEARYADGTLAGWVTKVDGQGYADRIELLLGLNPSAEEITGLYILDQKETPGLGNKIVEQRWRDQFTQKKTQGSLKVVKGGAKEKDEIDSVSGATISSNSVVDIINKTVADLKQPLAVAARNQKD